MSSLTSLSMQLGIPMTPDYPTDPIQQAEFQRIYNAVRVVAHALDTYTGNSTSAYTELSARSASALLRLRLMDVVYPTATEDIAAGAACHVWYDAIATTWSAKLADNSIDTEPYKFCTGFCVTDKGVTSGSVCAVNIGGGLVPYIGGLVEGYTYYLSSTPGVITPNKPATGFIQPLGYAIGQTYFYFVPTCVTS